MADEEGFCATQEPAEEEEEGEEDFAVTQEPAAVDTLQPELPRLVLRQLGSGLVVDLHPGSAVMIGRRPTADIILAADHISGEHARVCRNAEGAVRVSQLSGRSWSAGAGEGAGAGAGAGAARQATTLMRARRRATRSRRRRRPSSRARAAPCS